MVIQGKSADLANWEDRLLTWQDFDSEFPDVLGGTYATHSTDAILKGIGRNLWRANGITFVNAEDLTICKQT